jgi:hypothetical protein
MICMAVMTVSGSLDPDPEAVGDGCVPNGTWTLNVALEDDGGCTDAGHPPVFLNTYTYLVSGGVTGGADDDGYEVVWLEDPDDPNVDFRLKAKGGGECEATLEHWDDDGTTLVVLRPHEENLVISGSGTFEVYEEEQR